MAKVSSEVRDVKFPWLAPATCVVALVVMAALLVSDGLDRPEKPCVDLESQAQIAFAEARLADSESALRKLLHRSPGNPASRVLLGRVLLDQQRVGEARSEFETCLKSDPSSFEAVRGLAEALERQGLSAAALLQYERAAHMREEDARPWRDLALAAERAGDDSRAADAIRRSLALNPDQPDLSNLLARLEARENEWDTGGLATMKARPINPEDFLPKSPVLDPNDWLPKPTGRPR